MAGPARAGPRSGLCLIFALWLRAARLSASARVFSAISAGPGAGAGQGVGCLVLGGGDILTGEMPPNVLLIVDRRNLTREYDDLKWALHHAPRGTAGAWKSSALARVMYLRGFEESFGAKGVALYLTRKKKASVGSKIQVCLVDRAQEPKYVPSDVYHDGRVLRIRKGTGCNRRERECLELRNLKKGVYGLVYDNFRSLPSDKTSLPVGLMKLLDEKDAVVLNMDMVAMIGTGSKTGLAAALAVSTFREAFLAKGIKVFYSQKDFTWTCCDDDVCRTCHEWHHWFEYANVDVAGADYEPTIMRNQVSYPAHLADMHRQCLAGDASRLSSYIASSYVTYRGRGCKEVAGATRRLSKKPPNCKCMNRHHGVHCGVQLVSRNKFNEETLMSMAACNGVRPYCSLRPCIPPTGRRP